MGYQGLRRVGVGRGAWVWVWGYEMGLHGLDFACYSFVLRRTPTSGFPLDGVTDSALGPGVGRAVRSLGSTGLPGLMFWVIVSGSLVKTGCGAKGCQGCWESGLVGSFSLVFQGT